MSLKAIEMQIALPRTQDAGKLQEQLQQRGQILQDQASDRVLKDDEKKRTTVMKHEQKEKAKFHEKEGSKGQDQSFSDQTPNKKQKELEKQEHPYKGHSIDYSG
ncbi:hypothetical protein LS684_08375 [Cytobacillus spongiae]|jgi:hypothetical protein|uniref:hypothetical protein n=1 Tax=Cytobacillus spongiae TaxID=2901381 RepID=UPI001F26BCCA|nr:hypothetical protein [Cytobacillus spongiae]UII57437.1 hypothetical protein LS684_08375 [Cytobacillus spongiae]